MDVVTQDFAAVITLFQIKEKSFFLLTLDVV